MKNATRLDEIEGYLRDGGTIDNLLIEPEPSDHKRQWSRIGKEIDQDIERVHRDKEYMTWRFSYECNADREI